MQIYSFYYYSYFFSLIVLITNLDFDVKIISMIEKFEKTS